MSRSRSFACCALAATAVFSACSSSGQRVASAPAAELPRGDDPSLIVLIVVDQMRGDYYDRFESVLDGGIAWLWQNGAVFTDGHQNHSMTATAPGHATISTGTEPAKHGVIGNTWFNRETGYEEYSGSRPRSPANLEVTALGDWMKARDARSKVFTASAKDRSAVMMGGQRPDGAYWYGRSAGDWVTSSFYTWAQRDWLDELNALDWLGRFKGTAWEPVLSPSRYDELGLVEIDTGLVPSGFPYALGSYSVHSGSSYYSSIYDTPFVDAYLAEFAKQAIENEGLGLDGSPDLLGLSFSALDSVGHDFGPDSPEALDTLIRLDRLLGDLIEYIDETVGLEHVVFALSADHGVVTYPEVEQMRGGSQRRLGAEDIICVQRAGVKLRETYGDKPWLSYGFYLDRDLVVSEGQDVNEMATALAGWVESCEAVERAWTDAEIAALPLGEGPLAEQRFRNNYFPGRGADVVLQLREGYLYNGSGLGTTHGSVYDYDTWVPVVFAGPGARPTRIDARVSAADIAPTLAAWLGIAFPDNLDGTDLSSEFRRE
ncbi:MAG: sulfatase-like hydrolase/transferase [Acidobacteria bacterium]|nr:sulfatase-like hydrolase/transferase [Acidobacteriota bacterium]